MSSANSGRGLKELIWISLYQPRKTVWSLPGIYGFSPGNLSIIVTPHERHGVSNHRQIDCFIAYSANKMKLSMFCVTGPLWGESTGNGGFP